MRQAHIHTLSDAELLRAAAQEPEAFGEFYRRHERAILFYLLRRTGRGELAADLTAEVFAAALASCRSRRRRVPQTPLAWLFGIAHHKLADSLTRGRIEDRARRELGMQPIALGREDLELIELIDRDGYLSELIASLPGDQRAAIRARVLQEREYPEIASELRCSESVVRKRVSRGLQTLRTRMHQPA
ncbi:MAG TPA: RNA polymerase sigma factor [Solirubrobacteraceae bacterium]|jgi:RNA polymerase sigma-70 factor (ECF subfamily)